MHAVTWMGLRNIMLTGSCLPGRPTQLSHPSQTYLCGWVRTHACTHAWCGPPTWQARTSYLRSFVLALPLPGPFFSQIALPCSHFLQVSAHM